MGYSCNFTPISQPSCLLANTLTDLLIRNLTLSFVFSLIQKYKWPAEVEDINAVL